MKELLELFISFLRVGMFGYGGGSAVAPLIHKEAVEKRGWINDDEFIDIVAIANSLPGASMVEMSTAVGYKIKGILGGIVAAFSITLPSMIAFTIVMVFLNDLVSEEVLNAVTVPVLAVVAALMFSLSKKFFIQSKKELSLVVIVLVSIASFLLIYFLGIHPSLVIIAMVAYVFISQVLRGKKI
ncbi:chromate transporter [Mycoplasmatota bacterium]|nr:chromate transporter [Mycoplasmatota bacterium]